MKLVMMIVFFYVLKTIQACNRPAVKTNADGAKKPPWERDWKKWNLPPDNEDWQGFVDLLGTREIVIDTSTIKQITYTSDEDKMRDAPGFPKRWLEVGPGSSGRNPPSKAKVVGYNGAAAYCMDPPDRGTGTTYWFLRWYYDSKKGRCRRFVYSGLGGNINMFIDERTCLESCFYPPKPCCVSETRIDFEKFLERNRRLLRRRYKTESKKLVHIKLVPF